MFPELLLAPWFLAFQPVPQCGKALSERGVNDSEVTVRVYFLCSLSFCPSAPTSLCRRSQYGALTALHTLALLRAHMLGPQVCTTIARSSFFLCTLCRFSEPGLRAWWHVQAQGSSLLLFFPLLSACHWDTNSLWVARLQPLLLPPCSGFKCIY